MTGQGSVYAKQSIAHAGVSRQFCHSQGLSRAFLWGKCLQLGPHQKSISPVNSTRRSPAHLRIPALGPARLTRAHLHGSCMELGRRRVAQQMRAGPGGMDAHSSPRLRMSSNVSSSSEQVEGTAGGATAKLGHWSGGSGL